MNAVTTALTQALCLPIRLYQWGISPLLGTRCRFAPSCSHYAAEALHTHGPAKGLWLAVRRICRCHPLGASGYDPVPPVLPVKPAPRLETR